MASLSFSFFNPARVEKLENMRFTVENEKHTWMFSNVTDYVFCSLVFFLIMSFTYFSYLLEWWIIKARNGLMYHLEKNDQRKRNDKSCAQFHDITIY